MSRDFVGRPSAADPLLTIFWPASSDPSVLPVRAASAHQTDSDALDLLDLPIAASVLRDARHREHVVIADGPRHIRLEARGVSLLDGPVRLTYDLADFRKLRARLHTLSRLEALVRLRRLPAGLYGRDTLAARWLQALAAWEMKQAGASQIEIAIALFGAAQIDEDSMDRMRKRVARLIALAKRRMNVAYGGQIAVM
ncbi:DNA -binding domain-containing protein [Sphingobium sp. YR768]|uniref:DNA -binding domain-containing protein n=1 Tax=Sphingobium sp. YR768 TaxID=1884365 RepID=UPI0008B5EEE3|nr:DUF2285 domain-containing protein [Sphingobium sp. YR768]SER22706.1 Uncharacterized conserved protein [Sphingobium sp. YR768]